MQLTNSPLIAVVGPTGCGKSALALAIAQSFGGEIINFDSVQVYRGLDIGSAKIPVNERLGIPHHLLDVVSPAEDFTAGVFASLARRCLAEIAARGTLPVFVGGTGFYLRSLLDGLSPAPAGNPELRQRLSQSPALHRFLRRIDAAAAARIHPNDRQKLSRAIELAIAVSSPAPREALEGYRALKIGLNPDRAALYNRLNRRSAAMFEAGLLDETQRLLESGIPTPFEEHAQDGRRVERPAERASEFLSPLAARSRALSASKGLQSLGYKQAVAVLEGRMSREEAILDVQIKTRQYAKRQMTWFRRETDVHWLGGFGEARETQQGAYALVRDFLAGSEQVTSNQ